jgi:hypothetical protein
VLLAGYRALYAEAFGVPTARVLRSGPAARMRFLSRLTSPRRVPRLTKSTRNAR